MKTKQEDDAFWGQINQEVSILQKIRRVCEECHREIDPLHGKYYKTKTGFMCEYCVDDLRGQMVCDKCGDPLSGKYWEAENSEKLCRECANYIQQW